MVRTPELKPETPIQCAYQHLQNSKDEHYNLQNIQQFTTMKKTNMLIIKHQNKKHNFDIPAYRHHRCRFRPPRPSDCAFGGYVSVLHRCVYNSFRRQSPWCQITENWSMWLFYWNYCIWNYNSVKLRTYFAKDHNFYTFPLTERRYRFSTSALLWRSSDILCYFNVIHVSRLCKFYFVVHTFDNLYSVCRIFV